MKTEFAKHAPEGTHGREVMGGPCGPGKAFGRFHLEEEAMSKKEKTTGGVDMICPTRKALEKYIWLKHVILAANLDDDKSILIFLKSGTEILEEVSVKKLQLGNRSPMGKVQQGGHALHEAQRRWKIPKDGPTGGKVLIKGGS